MHPRVPLPLAFGSLRPLAFSAQVLHPGADRREIISSARSGHVFVLPLPRHSLVRQDQARQLYVRGGSAGGGRQAGSRKGLHLVRHLSDRQQPRRWRPFTFRPSRSPAPTRGAGSSSRTWNTPPVVSTLDPTHQRATNALASVTSAK
jgi:hypothetical protein